MSRDGINGGMMNVRSRRNSTCPWHGRSCGAMDGSPSNNAMELQPCHTPFNGASLRRLGIPLMNIFARLGLSGNSGASKVLCSFSASGHAVVSIQLGGGHVVSLQKLLSALWVGWELGDVCCMYVDTVIYA